MDQVFESICPALCMCWLVPVAVIGGLVLVIESVATGWRWRGLDKQGLFCRGCRFDLRGAASRRCAECGTILGPYTVLAPGIDPPMNLGFRILLATLGCIGPLILLAVLLAMVMPFNHTTERTLNLTPVQDYTLHPEPILMWGLGERSLFGKGRPSALYFNPGWTMNQGPNPGEYVLMGKGSLSLPLADDDDQVVTDGDWIAFNESYGMGENFKELEAARSELVIAIRYMAGSQSELPEFVHYKVYVQSSTRFDPLGWFFLVEVVLGLVVWGLLVRWVVVAHRRALEVYWGRQSRALEKLDEWIARNRAAAGLGKE